MVIDFVIVTVPAPLGSRQLISPNAAVFEIAPAKVLQGAVRLHGSASLPTPEVQVRVACACAGAASANSASAVPAAVNNLELQFMVDLLLMGKKASPQQATATATCRLKSMIEATSQPRASA